MIVGVVEALWDYHSGGSDPEPVNQRILTEEKGQPLSWVSESALAP